LVRPQAGGLAQNLPKNKKNHMKNVKNFFSRIIRSLKCQQTETLGVSALNKFFKKSSNTRANSSYNVGRVPPLKADGSLDLEQVRRELEK
jgi:hypothetical protein